MSREIRQALRALSFDRGFAATAIVTIALAIAVNVAIFAILHAVVLSPLPYADATKVVAVWEVLEGEGGHPWRVAPKTFVDWREKNRAFSAIAAFGSAQATLTGVGDPIALNGSRVTESYFELLGVTPRLGRTFRIEDTVSGAAPVVLISEELWTTRFGRDPSILGRSLPFDGVAKTVVGVIPSTFLPVSADATTTIAFGSDASFWVPYDVQTAAARRGRSHVLGVVARLASAVDPARAEREMTSLQLALRREDGGNRALAARVRPIADEAEGVVRPALILLWSAALFVLLIACVNVANLHIARSESRRRELAIRAALGASRGRIARQLLTESLLLAWTGGALGIVLAGWALPLLIRLVPAGVPRLSDVALRPATATYALLLATAAGLFFGIGPLLRWRPRAFERDLRLATGSTAGSHGTRQVLGSLVLAEIALACLLVVGAGLVTRSFGRLAGVDMGFRAPRVLVVPVPIAQSVYDRWEKVAAFHASLLARLRAEHGVSAAALAYNHPLEAQWSMSADIVGRPAPPPELDHSVWFRSVSEGYFATVGVPIRQGRDFDAHDDASHPGVAIVNETFARKEFPGEAAIGKRIRSLAGTWTWGKGLPEEFEIVGIAGDTRFLGPAKDPEPAYYLSSRQFPITDMKVLLRTDGDPMALVPAVRAAMRQLDPAQPVGTPTTVESLADQSVAQPRFAMRLMLAFGVAGLALAALGIYGLLSFVVALRTREIGVRMALGARSAGIVGMVLADVAKLTGGGAAIGIAGALAATPLLRGLLFGISPADPLSILAAPAALALVALSAGLLPARRAARVDPMVSLRND